jgi:hypothetical protein
VVVWKQQGAALVGALSLLDGRAARVVLMGPRTNPRGAMVAIPAPGGEGAPEVVSLAEAVELLHPQQIIESLCAQERCFGNGPLPRLDNA